MTPDISKAVARLAKLVKDNGWRVYWGTMRVDDLRALLNEYTRLEAKEDLEKRADEVMGARDE